MTILIIVMEKIFDENRSKFLFNSLSGIISVVLNTDASKNSAFSENSGGSKK